MSTDPDLSQALDIVHKIADIVRDQLAAPGPHPFREIDRLHSVINKLGILRTLLVGMIEKQEDAAPMRAWLEWFWKQADFGPAHDDVIDIMYAQFTAETGISVPSWEGS